EKNKIKLTLTFNPFDNWEDFFILSKNIEKTDFLIMISARKGYVSHYHYLDDLPTKLERHFNKLSKISFTLSNFRFFIKIRNLTTLFPWLPAFCYRISSQPT